MKPTPEQREVKAEYYARLRAQYDDLDTRWKREVAILKEKYYDSFMREYSLAMHKGIAEGYSVRFIRQATGHTDARTVRKILDYTKDTHMELEINTPEIVKEWQIDYNSNILILPDGSTLPIDFTHSNNPATMLPPNSPHEIATKFGIETLREISEELRHGPTSDKLNPTN